MARRFGRGRITARHARSRPVVSRRRTSSSAQCSNTRNEPERSPRTSRWKLRDLEDLPQQTERERRYLSHAELLGLARATDRFETLTLVLGYCGLRFGEAAALRRKHVGDRELTIRASATHVTGQGIVESSTKTRRARQVPVPGPVWDRLKNELPDDPNALVFPRRRGGLLPIEEYRRAFDKACVEVGIEGLVPHGLRHTTASLAISAGANLKISRWPEYAHDGC